MLLTGAMRKSYITLNALAQPNNVRKLNFYPVFGIFIYLYIHDTQRVPKTYIIQWRRAVCLHPPRVKQFEQSQLYALLYFYSIPELFFALFRFVLFCMFFFFYPKLNAYERDKYIHTCMYK